jgi:DNA polymerase III subunit delta
VADPLLRALERRGKGGVFFLSGEDVFRRDQAAKTLVEAHLDEGTRDFNLDILRGPELTVEHLASVMATPPMMADWRVAWVKDGEALAASSRARTLILEIAGAPPPQLTLVLVASIGGSKAKFWKELARAATPIEFPAVTDEEVPAWLMERARETLGVAMTEDAARALGAAVGTNLGVLARELEKLADYVQEGSAITRADVEAAGTKLPSQDRWQWFERVGEKDFAEALSGLPVLLGQGESGVGLVIGLTTQLMRIGAAMGGGAAAVAASLPGHQKWLAEKAARQGRRWSEEEIEGALLGLLRADRLLKASGVSEEAIVEEWLLGRLATAQGTAA